MTVFDYRRNAVHRAGGPDYETAVVAIAEFLHRNESIHMHELSDQQGPCAYCWLRAGNSIQALRLAGMDVVQPVGRPS